ncbi:nuclease-related domain-containing protein, partial [Parvimonas sp. D9]|uniref:nuclease-related domain-containing protein n=1 Tax=Parvimonas sp. D9 TaxID=3110689 RepID=UPI002B4961F8
MLLKDADDRSVDLVELEGLLELKLSRAQRAAVEREIWNVRRGIAGERDAAHYLDAFFHDSEQTVVIHDLRLEMDGRAVQIDHLLLTRFRTAYVLETKNYGGRLSRNDRGEWSAFSGRGRWARYDVPSPAEQALSRVRDLQRWFRRQGLTVIDRIEAAIIVPPDGYVPRRQEDDEPPFIK